MILFECFFMTSFRSALKYARHPKRGLKQSWDLSRRSGRVFKVIGEGFGIIYRNKMYKNPNHPENTRHIQDFCTRWAKAFNIQVQIHGTIPDQTALWVSNHISWLDMAILGSSARVFFLAKAEVASWPIFGPLTRWAGTLFIRRGSGDSAVVRQQITEFLKQDIPVLFFPEATTTDGRTIKKIHGKLFGAAIDAQKPVQICLLCYVNQDGELDQVVPFIGQQTIAQSVARILQMPKVTAHLMALPSISSQGHTPESLTQVVADHMQQGLKALHAIALTPTSAPRLDLNKEQ